MGTALRAVVEASGKREGAEAIEAAFGAVREADRLLSTWRSDSDLARLNAAPPGRAVRLPPALGAVLGEVAVWRDALEGAFDPAIGSLIAAWDLRGAGRIPSAPALEAARRQSGPGQFVFRGDSVGERRHEAAWIDAGGFGKGVALRGAGGALRRRGIRSAFVSFGGQVLALGAPPDAEHWRVPVAHPRRRGEAVTALRVRDRSVATSGQSERFVEVAGARYGHVLDPRSGLPVRPWGSVTVVAADPMAADILSTGLFVLGPEPGLAWAGAHGVAALFVIDGDQGMVMRWSENMERYLEGS